MSFQDEINSLVLWTSGFVAQSLQIAADMRLIRASPAIQNPARHSLILKAHWNKSTSENLKIQTHPQSVFRFLTVKIRAGELD